MKASILALLFISFFSIQNDVFADRRYFGRSYTAATLPQGALEFELWNTIRTGRDAGYYYRFDPRFEFEYGATDRLTTSLYFNFSQSKSYQNAYSSAAMGLASVSIEARYRLSNPGDWFIDPALYAEAAYGGNEVEYEAKAILSKRFGGSITTLNIAGELERDVVNGGHESKLEVTGGWMYDLNVHFAAGVEARAHYIFEDVFGEKEASGIFIGPSCNIQTPKFYLTLSLLKQVSGDPATKDGLDLRHHEDYEIRTILGISL